MFYHDSTLDTTSKIVIKETFSFHEFVVMNNLKKTDKLFHRKHGLNYLICCVQYSGYQLCVFLNTPNCNKVVIEKSKKQKVK